MVSYKMLLMSNPVDESKVECSYQEFLNVLVPDKSQQEHFLKECRYMTLTEVKPNAVLPYIADFTQKKRYFSLYIFLIKLEKLFNQKRQELAYDFSNYTNILMPEQLQILYTGMPKTKALSFLKTFFAFEVDTEIVYIQLLMKFRQQPSDKNIFNKFLAVLKNSSLTDTFEFFLECYSLQDRERWLLADIRLAWIFMLRYLTENPQLYEQLIQTFYGLV